MPLIWIPTPLRHYSNGVVKLTVQGRNLREIIDNLDSIYPGLKEAIVKKGLVREEITVAIDGEIIHQGLFQEVPEQSEVHFIPTIGGG